MTDSNDLVVSRRQIVIVLQFLVGSLVTFGGTAFALLAVNSFGTALGSVHLLIGAAGLLAGILAIRQEILPRTLLLVTNTFTILYSISSVSIAAIDSLLPTSALHDSLIGTAAAVIMSIVIVYLLPRSSAKMQHH